MDYKISYSKHHFPLDRFNAQVYGSDNWEGMMQTVRNEGIAYGVVVAGSIEDVVRLQLADWLSKQDWKTYTVDRLEEVYKAAHFSSKAKGNSND